MMQSPSVKRLTESPLVKRLLWIGLRAGIGALASLASARLAGLTWMRVFGARTQLADFVFGIAAKYFPGLVPDDTEEAQTYR